MSLRRVRRNRVASAFIAGRYEVHLGSGEGNENARKHRVTFEGAISVFDDLHAFRARRHGRPTKGETTEGTFAKTERLPQSTYDELVRLAGAHGISTHVALRRAVANWIVEASEQLAEHGKTKPRKRARKGA